MAHWRESICATCRFAARRSASTRLAAPERRMSSCVITWIAEAVCDSRSGRFDTELTCRFINCSMLNFFRASADRLESGRWPPESGCCANPGRTKHTRPNVKTSDVAAATVFIPAIGRYPLVYGLWRSRIIPAQHALLAQRRGDPCHVPRHGTTQHGRSELGRFCGTDWRFRDTPASLSGGRALAQQFPNHLEQLAWFERLDQRAGRAQSRRGLQHLDLSGPAPTRHAADPRLGMLGTKGADHFQPVPLGHEDVHQNEIGTLLALQAQPGVPVGCFQHLVASCLERDADRAPKHAIIIHHQDSCHGTSMSSAMNPVPAALFAQVPLE